MKGGAGEIDSGAVTEPADYVWMTDTIKRYRFVLKILDEGMFEASSGASCKTCSALDYYGLRSVIRGRMSEQRRSRRSCARPRHSISLTTASLLCCSLSSGISLTATPPQARSCLRRRRTQGEGDPLWEEADGEGTGALFRRSAPWRPVYLLSDFKATAANPSVASFLSVASACGEARLVPAITFSNALAASSLLPVSGRRGHKDKNAPSFESRGFCIACRPCSLSLCCQPRVGSLSTSRRPSFKFQDRIVAYYRRR